MIYLDKELLASLPPHSAMVYVAMRSMMRNEQEEDYYTFGRICFALGLSFDDYWSEQMKFGIVHMMKIKLIEPMRQDKKNHGWVINISKLQLDIKSRYYTTVSNEEIYTITKSDMPNNKKMALLKYYLMIIGSFNHSKDLGEYSGKVGSMPVSYYAELAQISERTALRYNECLEDLGLLYIHKSTEFIKKYDGLSQITNVYSRPEDKILCDRYAKEYESKYGYNQKKVKSKHTKDKANENRSLAQKYNQMRKGKKYDEETTEEIRQYIVSQNEKYQKEIKFFKELGSADDVVDDLSNRIRDLSVFV